MAHSAHLVLASVSRARAGSFVCEATNSLATSQSSEAVIDVKCECCEKLASNEHNLASHISTEYIFRRSDCCIS